MQIFIDIGTLIHNCLSQYHLALIEPGDFLRYTRLIVLFFGIIILVSMIIHECCSCRDIRCSCYLHQDIRDSLLMLSVDPLNNIHNDEIVASTVFDEFNLLLQEKNAQKMWDNCNCWFLKHKLFKNPEALWRMSKVSFLYAVNGLHLDNGEKKLFFEQARDFAHSSLHSGGKDIAETHYWYAVTCYTCLSSDRSLSLSERIGLAIIAYYHLDKLNRSQMDYLTFHIKGQLIFLIRSFNWTPKRLFIQVLYGRSIFPAKLEDAIYYFLTAANFGPDWEDNWKAIRKCCEKDQFKSIQKDIRILNNQNGKPDVMLTVHLGW